MHLGRDDRANRKTIKFLPSFLRFSAFKNQAKNHMENCFLNSGSTLHAINPLPARAGGARRDIAMSHKQDPRNLYHLARAISQRLCHYTYLFDREGAAARKEHPVLLELAKLLESEAERLESFAFQGIPEEKVKAALQEVQRTAEHHIAGIQALGELAFGYDDNACVVARILEPLVDHAKEDIKRTWEEQAEILGIKVKDAPDNCQSARMRKTGDVHHADADAAEEVQPCLKQ
jgi:hypothetical protein